MSGLVLGLEERGTYFGFRILRRVHPVVKGSFICPRVVEAQGAVDERKRAPSIDE